MYPWGICNVEDDKHTDYMKLYSFIRDYGFPYIIEAAREKYKKFVGKEKRRQEIAKAVQKRVCSYDVIKT